MKKSLILVFLIFFSILFVACSNGENVPQTLSMEDRVAERVEEVVTGYNVSDETIKALSIIIRTNEQKFPSSTSTLPKDERIKSITNQTSGLILVKEDSNVVPNSTTKIDSPITYYYKKEDSNWSREIKKSELLKFLSNNNISLSNISSIEVEKTDDGCVSSIIIGGKVFDYGSIASEFNLPSNKITNISSSISSVLVEGEGVGHSKSFSISEADTLSKQGKSYDEILMHFFPDYEISSNVKNF